MSICDLVDKHWVSIEVAGYVLSAAGFVFWEQRLLLVIRAWRLK